MVHLSGDSRDSVSELFRSLGSAFVLLAQREDGVEVGTSRWGGSSATFVVTLVWSLH